MTKIQTVYITLSDGRIGGFTGPALVDFEDSTLEVTDIKFSTPKELPEEYKMEMLDVK